MRYTIQETYEYYVEADSPDQAQEIFEAYQGDTEEYEHFSTVYGEVEFTQNYTHIFDNEGKEV